MNSYSSYERNLTTLQAAFRRLARQFRADRHSRVISSFDGAYALCVRVDQSAGLPSGSEDPAGETVSLHVSYAIRSNIGKISVFYGDLSWLNGACALSGNGSCVLDGLELHLDQSVLIREQAQMDRILGLLPRLQEAGFKVELLSAYLDRMESRVTRELERYLRRRQTTAALRETFTLPSSEIG